MKKYDDYLALENLIEAGIASSIPSEGFGEGGAYSARRSTLERGEINGPVIIFARGGGRGGDDDEYYWDPIKGRKTGWHGPCAESGKSMREYLEGMFTVDDDELEPRVSRVSEVIGRLFDRLFPQ